MPKKLDERYDKAYEMYQQGFKLVEIASQLDLPEGTVRRWKSTHKWESERSDKESERSHKRKGGQPGNKNATGPPRNQNARKHGLFAKWLPEEINEIIREMPDDQLDILWHNIQLQYANIIHSQQILYVEDKDDKTKELTFNGEKGEGYEVQYAWDKQAGNMSALSRSMKTLMSMIKEYDELLHKNWKQASDEQVARINQIKAQTRKLEVTDQTEKELSKVDQILKEMQEDAKSKAG